VNARAHGVADRLKLIACDLASSVRQRFPLIVANLPYIPSADISALEPEISSYEPHEALDGGADGTMVVRRFLAQLDGILAPGGTAILEMGEGQADALHGAVQHLGPGYASQVASDYTGTDRFLVLERAVV
jgi:release factor glutamine methyltransferase